MNLASLLLLLALPASASSSAATQPPPEAVVSASSGPIKITLQFYRKKLGKMDGVWYKLIVTNVGKKDLELSEKVFADPWAMKDSSREKSGLYLDIQDGGGNQVFFNPRGGTGSDVADGPFFQPLGADEQKRWDTKRAEWRKQGLSETDVEYKVARARIDERRAASRAPEKPRDSFLLAPSASTTTPAWAAPYSNFAEPVPTPKLLGDYTELPIAAGPGRYRIRAVYDRQPPCDKHQDRWLTSFCKEHPDAPRRAWDVLVQTPYIKFEIAP